ncbi:MAG TPA: outer membrane protein assembly factor BamD, partial [Thermodesulfobacteriota bacterium]
SASAETLYNAAMAQLEKKRGFPWLFTGTDYDTVFKLLKEIQLRYTYSPYAILAELRTGDAYFKKEEYEQAAVEYEEFIKRHPGHQETSYATYRLTLSHFKRMKSYDRDPTDTRDAIKWSNIFIEKYPDSPLVGDAKSMIVKCRDNLAKREVYIGNFYSRRKNYKASANRYKVVVEKYRDTKEYEKGLYLLGKSYYDMGENQSAKDILNRVIQEFPQAEYHNKAANLLAKIEKKEKEQTKEEGTKG